MGGFVVLAGCWVILLALVLSAALRQPNPDPSLDGEPCCAYPDTWADVAIGAGYTVATAIAAVGIIGLGVVAMTSAVQNQIPTRVRRSGFLRWFGATALACAIAVPLSWVVWPD